MMNRHLLFCILLLLLPGGKSFGQLSYQDAESFHRAAPRVPEKMVFAGDTIRFHTQDRRERMDRELLSFTNMHTNSALMLKRSARIFRQVEPILRQERVPDDLKYLMAIESNLDPKSVSVAGAAGLWQFMKGTAPRYGLEVSPEVDERFHIEKSTRAACKYLKESWRRYGDWMTVAASYNAGQANISRRQKEQRQSSALDLWLAEETARYMYRILAAKLFFEHPESFGYRIPAADRYPYIAPRAVVTVVTGVPSLTEFALEHETTYARLKEANLWLRDTLLTNKAARTYRIVIPGD